VSIYLAELTVIVGLLLLAVEVWLLGLSTIVLLATGVAAILGGTLGDGRRCARNGDGVI
jgi:hypothetical protein